ncbi:MAG: CRISPR-associated protein [Desulfotomaculum sp. 46_296]|nr:MAG: CRISPR-associated protein [Desulfotomaculum sp. 46_296]
MGFLGAVRALGELRAVSGWEAHLKFPLEKFKTRQKTKKGNNRDEINEGHKIMRIWLTIDNLQANQLKIQDVKKIDLIDYKTNPDMKTKYLYKDRIGTNTSWGFTPIFKMGKPQKEVLSKKNALIGKSGNWPEEGKSIFYKLRNRLLEDYETCKIFSPGSVELIMNKLTDHIDQIISLFDGNGSFIMVFGANNHEQFLFPGEIPAFINYFKNKLKQHLQKDSNMKGTSSCFYCGRFSDNPATLDKIFKFATFDKVNVLPGLNEKSLMKVQPVCQDCLQYLTAGREIIERELADKSTIFGIIIWLIPEVIGIEGTEWFLKKALEKLNFEEKGATGMGSEAERRFFHRLTKQETGLVFHFLFWERIKAQERIHLMVEDVPPTWLVKLENAWIKAVENLSMNWERNLDTAFNTLYSTCMALSGQSNEDKVVMRDFVIKVLGKILKSEQLPTQLFKAMFVRRIPKLVFDCNVWSDVQFTSRKAQLVVEFLEQINKEVALIEAGSKIS